MSKGRDIRSFDYVNYPYALVRDALTGNALEVFGTATHAATSRAHDVASQLRVDLGGIAVSTDIEITVREITERPAGAASSPSTVLRLEWAAAKRPQLFPFMRAELSIYPLTATETQLELAGTYEPPLGVVGGIMDAMIGHRVAEASVHRFVADVAAHLRTTLAPATKG